MVETLFTPRSMKHSGNGPYSVPESSCIPDDAILPSIKSQCVLTLIDAVLPRNFSKYDLHGP